jgi:hypothetical protein
MKKNIIIWANCQGSSIKNMFNKYYSELFNVEHFVNYELLKQTTTIPDKFKQADIFIYQNYSDRPDCPFDLTNLLTNILKPQCITVSIPFLQFEALYCYDSNNPKNSKTINNSFPHGKFFCGIGLINDQFDNSIDYLNMSDTEKTDKITKITNLLMSDNAVSEETILHYYNRSFEYLEKKILSSNVPELFDFIKYNFTTKNLFHNRYHPSGLLLNELIKHIFKYLNLHYDDCDENVYILNKTLNNWVMPLLPCVKKYYNCSFDDVCSSWYNSNITDSTTFIQQYITDLYFT